MERKRLNASNLRSAGYDARNRVLEIEFSNGGINQYAGVPDAVIRMTLTGALSRVSANVRHKHGFKTSRPPRPPRHQRRKQ